MRVICCLHNGKQIAKKNKNKKKTWQALMLTLRLERVKSSCILRLWGEIMRQSLTGPFDGSFCLVVLTKKKKSLKTDNIHGNCSWAKHSFRGSSILDCLLSCVGSRDWSKQILSIYGAFQLIFSFQVIRRQPSLGCSYFTLQTQGHPGTNQAAKCKHSTPWGNSSLLPK